MLQGMVVMKNKRKNKTDDPAVFPETWGNWTNQTAPNRKTKVLYYRVFQKYLWICPCIYAFFVLK